MGINLGDGMDQREAFREISAGANSTLLRKEHVR